MIKHIVMWTLKNPADAPAFQARLLTCAALVPGTQAFEVAIKTAALSGNCDVVLYSVFDDARALLAYQKHPHHQMVSAELGLLRDSRTELDYAV